MTTKLTAPDDIHPGPVLPDSLNELVAVAQNLGANILEIPEGERVTLELAGRATIILAQPADPMPSSEPAANPREPGDK